MLLVLDNYDSFTYNLVQYAGELGAEPVVYRNDVLSVEAIYCRAQGVRAAELAKVRFLLGHRALQLAGPSPSVIARPREPLG